MQVITPNTGNPSGLFAKTRTSTSLFKHSLQLDCAPGPGVSGKQKDKYFMTNKNYESKFDTVKNDQSASSRKFSTK